MGFRFAKGMVEDQMTRWDFCMAFKYNLKLSWTIIAIYTNLWAINFLYIQI